MFSHWMGLKCLFITLRSSYSTTEHESSPSMLPSPAGFSSPREVASPQSHATRSGFQMTSPFYCLQQSNYAEPRAGGKVFHIAHFAAPSNTRGVSSKRLWISTHIFWCGTVHFGQSFWLYVTVSYCIIIFGGMFSHSGHSQELKDLSHQKKWIKMQKNWQSSGSVFPVWLHHKNANYNNLMLSRL